MLKIPYGLADFKMVISNDCFYLDRTHYIEQLERSSSWYPMYLRPRRFGKSLFISMLEYYYGIEHADKFQKLFGALYIGKQPTPLANQYLVMRFDFSGIETNDVKNTYESFLKKVKSGVSQFMSTYQELFTAEQILLVGRQTTPSAMMVDFFDIFKNNKIKRPIYLLIDEYDQFTNELLAFHFHDFQTIVSRNGYVRKFYEVLKTATGAGQIARLFMTGVAPVTVDSMTSGFNITKDITLSERFHDMMGFTEPEVVDFLKRLEIPAAIVDSKLNELRIWYDGYRFNGDVKHHLYNTDMVLYFGDYYLTEGKYPNKMLDANIASDYRKIANIFRMGNNETTALAHLNYLLENGAVQSYVTERFNIELGFNIIDVWSMLFYTGMTTVKSIVGNDWTFMIPNYVIKKLYYDYFVALSLGIEYGNLRQTIRDTIQKLVFQGKIVEFANLVGIALTKAHSNRDKIAYGEKHLKTLMIGLLFPYESYRIRSKHEEETRYPDIFLERIPQVNIKHEVVLELKYIKKEDGLKWVDNQGNMVEPPASLHSTPKKKGRKPKTPVVTVAPTNPPVRSLLEAIAEEGTQQLTDYMQMERFKRPNILGFCLIFVGNECRQIIDYQVLFA